MKYIVAVREVHVQYIAIEAIDPTQAKEFVGEGQGDIVENSLEYSHTLAPDTWTVEEAE